eukprot:9771898-Alexandrium_andersonii.AAC.1
MTPDAGGHWSTLSQATESEGPEVRPGHWPASALALFREGTWQPVCDKLAVRANAITAAQTSAGTRA